MRILLAHNRYRSVAPSGENRVVDREGEALAAHGHEVIRFERFSDDIEDWPKAKKATLPARAVWSREAHRDLAAVLAAQRPDVVHLPVDDLGPNQVSVAWMATRRSRVILEFAEVLADQAPATG